MLTVRATEIATGNNEGGASSETRFRIRINDLNDNRPQFGQPFYQISIPESTPVGSILPILISVKGRYVVLLHILLALSLHHPSRDTVKFINGTMFLPTLYRKFV